MAHLGVRPKSTDLGHVSPFDGDAIAFGWFERFWDNRAHGFRCALIRHDELVHVFVVPRSARISGSHRRPPGTPQDPADLRSLRNPLADPGCFAGYDRVLGLQHIHVNSPRSTG